MYKGFESAWQAHLANIKPGERNKPDLALRFSRFFEQSAPAGTGLRAQIKQQENSLGQAKATWLNQHVTRDKNVAASGFTVGDKTRLAALWRERLDWLAQAPQRRFLAKMQVKQKFVSGCGQDHPLENGFSWHPLLATPWLPGAALKGLARAFATHWLAWPAEDVQACFGDTPPQPGQTHTPSNMGGVIFFDMLPCAPVVLQQDVMTPHIGDWILQGDQIQQPLQEWQRLPAPWHNPVPIPFLCVQGGEFALALQAQPSLDQALFARLCDCVQEALDVAGAGAKTASGYGRFRCAMSHADICAQLQEEQEARANALAQQAAQQAAAQRLALPEEVRLEYCLQTVLAKQANENVLADYLLHKQFKTLLADYGLSTAQVGAAMWQHAELGKLLRRWKSSKKALQVRVLQIFPQAK